MGLNPDYVIERNGRRFVLFAGLLSLAHDQSEGRLHIATELIQVPNELNGMVAICRCEAKIAGANGAIIRSCTGIGDASPDNVSRMVANALIRMAEARSKSRALRDLVNVSEAVDEAEEDPREPDGGRVETTIGRRPESPKTVRERYRDIYERGKRENLTVLPLHADPQSTDKQMIAEGRWLQAKLKSIYGQRESEPAGARP